MGTWVPGGRGRPPKFIPSPKTGKPIKNRYVPRTPRKINKGGQDIIRIWDIFLDDRNPLGSWQEATFKQRHSKWRILFLQAISEMLYAAKENVAESIESGFGEMVVGPLLEEARTNMKGDYEKVMGQEPNTKRNPWVQEDPSESDAFKYIRAEIDGEERKISWHGGNSSPIDPSRRRNRIFNSNMYQTRAMRSVKYRFQAIDTDELDAVKDRPLGDSISLKVAIPFYQRGSSETNKANVFMRSFLAVGKPHDNQAGYDEYVKILEYNINSRTSKKVDKFTGGTWKLWRAIEYGQVSSRYKRVFAKNVISYKEVPTEVKEDDMRSDAKVAYASSIVTDDAWTIFMSPHWKWWSRQAVPVNGKLLIKVDNGSSYQVGLAPIRKAIMRGTNDEYMNMLITSLIDSAMTDAGFIRG